MGGSVRSATEARNGSCSTGIDRIHGHALALLETEGGKGDPLPSPFVTTGRTDPGPSETTDAGSVSRGQVRLADATPTASGAPRARRARTD